MIVGAVLRKSGENLAGERQLCDCGPALAATPTGALTTRADHAVSRTGFGAMWSLSPSWLQSGRFEAGVTARFLGFDDLLQGRHFDREIIVLCVPWHLRLKVSLRDLVEMIPSAASRSRTPRSCVGSTIMLRSSIPARTVSRSQGASWGVDETYVNVRAERAIPPGGRSRREYRRLPSQPTA